MNQSNKWVWFVVACFTFFAGVWLFSEWTKTTVTVLNRSGHLVRNVVLTVWSTSQERTYSLGMLGNGEARTIRVHPTGEAGLKLDFLGEQSRAAHWEGGYIEPAGYRDRLVIGLDDEVDYNPRLAP